MTLLSLHDFLAEGFPVVFSLRIYKDLDIASEKEQFFVKQIDDYPKIMVLPPKDKRPNFGGHAVLAIGYNDTQGKEWIFCQNSWGNEDIRTSTCHLTGFETTMPPAISGWCAWSAMMTRSRHDWVNKQTTVEPCVLPFRAYDWPCIWTALTALVFIRAVDARFWEWWKALNWLLVVSNGHCITDYYNVVMNKST